VLCTNSSRENELFKVHQRSFNDKKAYNSKSISKNLTGIKYSITSNTFVITTIAINANEEVIIDQWRGCVNL